MANFKNITDLPVAESAEGINLIVNDNGSAKQIAASAVGAQADFNVTDENHPAFIKNKPFGVKTEIIEIVSMTEVDISQNHGSSHALHGTVDVSDLFGYSHVFVEGEAYVVNFDGVEYECVAGGHHTDDGAVYFIGNQYLENNNWDDTDIPFFICEGWDFGPMRVYTHVSNAGTHTFSISQRKEVVTPLDPKFIHGEWDLDIEIIGTFVATDDEGNGEMNYTHTVNSINTFENIKNKILSGIQPKCKVKIATTGWGNTDSSRRYTSSFDTMFSTLYPEFDGDLARICFGIWGWGSSPYVVLLADDTIVEVGDDN